MGAADGPVFAPPTEGAKSRIEADPCGCPECVAGPGLDHQARRDERLERVLGSLTKVVTYDFCPSCRDSVITTAVRSGPGWENTCKFNHTWRSFD